MNIYRAHILVCSGTNCSLHGSQHLREVLVNAITEAGLEDEVKVVETGCFGLCEQGPVMTIYPEGVMYTKIQVPDIKEIVNEHLLKGRIVERLLYSEPDRGKNVQTRNKVEFYGKQVRVVLRNCGLIDPEKIEEYIAHNGYEALGKVISQYTPAEVIEIIKDAGLRGRGGAGFPTGLKWQFTAAAKGEQKYVICNADEGEPGTFKDRLILEGDPHSIIEGMAICAYAIGANKGYVYIRGEYRQSIEMLEQAIEQAKELGILGDNIFGGDFSFDIKVRTGAGAYVCGEETALIESMEGDRGEPRFKPPYPANHGLWGKPTVVNNVETLANIAPIILNGSKWFHSIGTEKSPGTKVFTMVGNINNSGLIEVPMGITLREVIYDIGGGIPNGHNFKMVQTGGSSGGCLSSKHLDLSIDYDSLDKYSSALGSGALLVVDDQNCIIDVVLNVLNFFKHESCGQCTPCREGTTRLYQLVKKFSDGTACEGDIKTIKRLARTMQQASLCALGQTAAVPVLSTLRYFNDEYEQHMQDKVCTTNTCQLEHKARA